MKRKIISICAAVALVVTCFTIPSLASESGSHSYGAVNENSTPVGTYEPAGGGDWWHGHNAVGWLYSDYKHRQQEHGSSCRGAWYADSGWQSPDHDLPAQSNCAPGVENYVYWRTR